MACSRREANGADWCDASGGTAETTSVPTSPAFQKYSSDESPGALRGADTEKRVPRSIPSPSSGSSKRADTTRPSPSTMRASALNPKSVAFASVVKVHSQGPSRPTKASVDDVSAAAPTDEAARATAAPSSTIAATETCLRLSPRANTSTATALPAAAAPTRIPSSRVRAQGHQSAVTAQSARPARSTGGRWGRGGLALSALIGRWRREAPRISYRRCPKRASSPRGF